LLIFSIDDKGKAIAALGMAMRATGYRQRTLMPRSIKGSWRYGGLDGLKRLAP
jgi:cob(I)alamin adenosyltransferase